MELENEAMKILATFPLEDKEIKNIAAATAIQLNKRRKAAPIVNYFAHIKELPQEALDALAEEMRIDWWDYSFSEEVKRRILLTAGKVRRAKGSEGAVLTALRAIFGDETEVFYPSRNRFVIDLPANLTYEKNGEIKSEENDVSLQNVKKTVKKVQRASMELGEINLTVNINVKEEDLKMKVFAEAYNNTAVFNGEYFFDGSIYFDN